MKTLRLIGMALIAVTMCVNFAACNNDDSNDNKGSKEAVITPSENSQNFFDKGLNFTSEAGSELVEFTTNKDWTLSVANTAGGEIWCTVSAENGKAGDNAITVKALENTGYDDRSVTLTIKAGNIEKTLTVTQKQKDAILLTSDKFEVDKAGGKIEIEVKSNIDYTVEIAENAKEWIKRATPNTRALTTNTLTFEISPSEEYDKRNGEIYFKSGEMTETVYVYQASGGAVLLTKDEYPVSDKGEAIKVELKSNCDYGVKMPDVDWIKNAPATKAMSSHTLYFVVSPNETYDNREAKIIFYDKKNAVATADTLTVIQMQRDAIILSQNSYEVDADGDSFDVELKANIDYTVTIPDESAWIKQVTTRGLVKNTLHFTVDKMAVNKDREGVVIIESTDSSLSSTITIIQKLKDISTLKLHIEQAGTLKDFIDFNRRYEIKELTLSGNLNGDDFVLISDIAGRGIKEESTSGRLKTLDISKARIVEGGGAYLIRGSDKYYTENNTISEYLFGLYQVEKIILSENVTAIKQGAFSQSAIHSLAIPNGVTSIGEYAFYNCRSLVSITIPNSVTNIGAKAFWDAVSLTSISIPDGIIKIEEAMFADCENLVFVSLPNSISSIGNSAFMGCKKLDITIPENIISIGEYAFKYCVLLFKNGSLTIPSKVATIGYGAFDCFNDHPKEIHCKAIVPPILTRMMYLNFSDDITLYVPRGYAEAYRNVKYWSWYKEIIEE